MPTPGDMRGKRVVITGATSGIGRATALALGASGASLFLLARRRAAGEALARKINGLGTGASALFVPVDLSSGTEVRQAAQVLRGRGEALDVLINNAGARFDYFATTVDGIERTFATNHLGHFLLTCLLLDPLLAAAPARIVTVASIVHHAAAKPPSWLCSSDNFDRKVAYARSKLANVLFSYELAGRLRGTRVTSNAVDPGIVASHFARNNGIVAWLKHLAYHLWKREIVSPARGAESVVYLATAPELASTTAGYFRDMKPAGSSELSHDQTLAAELWRLSVELSQLDGTLGECWKLIRP